MTLNEIMTLIKISVIPDVVLLEHWEKKAVAGLEEVGMVICENGSWKTIERGECFVNHLRDLPMPKPSWSMPRASRTSLLAS